MPRVARLIAPGIPHHVTQRGNRRMQTFFCDEDYQAYLSLMAQWCRKFDVAVWCYCLMPNHIHLIAVPETEAGLRLAIGEAHRRYSVMVNRRQKWTGHLWQGRFSSFPMDETYLLAAAKYIEMNPVRAKLVPEPYAWKWSSAKPHADGTDDITARGELSCPVCAFPFTLVTLFRLPSPRLKFEKQVTGGVPWQAGLSRSINPPNKKIS